MSLSAKLRRAPLRAVTGAFILGSGVEKLKADAATAEQLHGMASGTYPFLGKVNPKVFVKGLAAGEVAVGAVVLAPFVSPVVAGAALAGFSGALLNLYWNTPGMHAEGDPRPTPQGVGVAKDVWLAGIGVALIADGLLEPAHDKKVEVVSTFQGKREGKHSRKEKKAAKKARAAARKHALESARDSTVQLSRRTQKAADKAAKKARKSDLAKSARKSSDRAVKSLSGAVDDYRPVVEKKAKSVRDAASDFAGEYGPVVAEKAKSARDAASDLAGQYAPVVAEKAKSARDAASDLAGQYGPVVAEKAKSARSAAQDLVDDYRPVVEKQSRRARKSAQKSAHRTAQRAKSAIG